MKAVRKFLLGGVAIAATSVAFAAPAAGQYYPGGGYGGGNVLLGAILDQILRGSVGGYGNNYGGYNYGGYNYANERVAVDQCARAAEVRLNGQYRGGYGYGGGYNAPYGGYGYNTAGVRVNQIERVERTRSGNFRVVGWAGDAGWRGNYGGYGNPYGGQYGNAVAPSYKFSCKFDARYGRVTDVDINRQRYARYGY